MHTEHTPDAATARTTDATLALHELTTTDVADLESYSPFCV